MKKEELKYWGDKSISIFIGGLWLVLIVLFYFYLEQDLHIKNLEHYLSNEVKNLEGKWVCEKEAFDYWVYGESEMGVYEQSHAFIKYDVECLKQKVVPAGESFCMIVSDYRNCYAPASSIYDENVCTVYRFPANKCVSWVWKKEAV